MTPSTPSSPHSTTPDTLEWSGPVLECEAVVIGAGPAGLFQVFQLGLQGIRAHLIDALPHVGGQCAELYGDKPIYDIPGIKQCSGLELVERLQAQIAPFAPSLHLKQQVHSVERQADGRWLIGTQQAGQPATRLLTLTVFIAAGVGAFVPRSLKLDGIESLLGRHVHHHSELAHTAQLPHWAGQHVVVHGGDEIAVRQAIALATQAQAAPAKVSLLHRRDVFQAAPELLSQLQQLRESGRIHVVIGQISGLQKDAEGALQALDYLDTEGLAQQLPLDHLLICLGVSPKLGPIAEWGLDMERKQLAVTPEHFRTNLPGIYAVGDIITYPGKRKLILCAFHEATLAAFDAAEQLSGAPVLLQYTTTSTRLHERLGVAVPTTRPPHAS